MPKKTKNKKGYGSNWLYIVIISLLTLFAGIYLLIKFSEWKTPIPSATKEKITPEETRAISLYFSNPAGLKLETEKRDVKKGEPASEIKETIEELIKGPSGKLIRTIPEETKILGVRFDKETVSLDFSKDITTKHPGGSSAEIQTIYSIVNTVVFNFNDFKKVQILIDGKKEKSLAGHIDISLPLRGDNTK